MKTSFFITTCFMSIMFILLFSISSKVLAGEFPNKAIYQIVPWSSGGGTDRFARGLSEFWEEKLDTSIVVENIPGAGTTRGNNKVWRADPNGYTMLVINIGALNFSALLHDTEWNIEDWAYIGLHHKDPNIAYAHPDVPADNIKELIEYVKENPKELTLGVPGVNNDQIVMIKMLEKKADVDFGQIIPAGGGSALLKEVAGGHIDVGFHRAFAGGIQAKANGLKPLGIASKERSDIWPECPTFNETLPSAWQIEGPFWGYKGYAVPKAVEENHPERFDLLVKTFKEIFFSEKHQEKIQEMGLDSIAEYKNPNESLKAIQRYDQMLKENKNLFRKNY